MRQKISNLIDDSGLEHPMRLHQIRNINVHRVPFFGLRVTTNWAKLSSLDADRPTTPKWRKRYHRTGKHYGFPMCCIRAFCHQRISERTDNQVKATQNGFVPCAQHADQIVSGAVSVVQLIRNRKHKLPFPHGY